MSKVSPATSFRRALLLGLVLLTASACGGGAARPKAVSKASPAGTETKPAEEGVAGRHEIPKSERVPSPKLIERRTKNAMAPDTLGLVKSKSHVPKNSAEVYRLVAPATVIIKAGGGLGSGVIIDPAGWVLTNHHVIAMGDTEDFKTKVEVVLGKMSKTTGGMVREAKSHDAYVYKDDKLRDIALIKISDPPKNLQSIAIAKDNPSPGQPVVALGHAGAGMLWALKAGEVSALGKLSEQLATLAQFKDDKAGHDAEESFKKYLDERNLGLVIQSTCNILPGDSGGPLVTKSGELVGLNAFSNQDPRTGGLLSFHIHRSELASFVKNKPAKPARLVPDPWKEGGGDASYEDVDLDGRVDALVLEGRRACSYCPRQSVAVFVDVDQDTFKNDKTLPPLKEVYEKHRFDAELAYLQTEKDAFVWYDTDNDGTFDLLIHDTGATGRATAVYHIAKDGDYQRDDKLGNGRDVRGKLLSDSGLRARFQRIAVAAFPQHYVEQDGVTTNDLPQPVGHTGNASVADLNYDGQLDAVRIDSAFSYRLLLDVDHDTVDGLPKSFTLGSNAPNVDAEVAVVTQSSHMWVWYDTDDDGRFDLALHSPGARLYVATDAWHVDEKGVRADLLQVPARAEALERIVKKGFLSILSTPTDAGIASFPDPILDHRGTSFELLEVKGAQKSVVTVYGQGSDGYLIDLDGNSLRSVSSKTKDLAKIVQNPKFDPEFAYFQRNGLAWSYYDTDNKGGYDLVLYSSDPRGGKADSGFRIDKSGKVTLDSSLKGKSLVSHSLFKKAADQKKLQKLGKELFGKRALEE
jgi:S1-C subfamily serine protease